MCPSVTPAAVASPLQIVQSAATSVVALSDASSCGESITDKSDDEPSNDNHKVEIVENTDDEIGL